MFKFSDFSEIFITEDKKKFKNQRNTLFRFG